MQEQGRAVIGDADLADRLGLGGDLRPQPDAVENEPGAVGNGRGAAVEPLVQHRRRVLAVDDRDLEARAGAGNAEQHPHQPAARDDQLGIIGHARRMGLPPAAVQHAPTS